MRLPAKATHAQTRQHNHRLVLRTVYDFGPISRAEVARSTGLTRTTVSDVVGDLLGDGMVEEVGRGPSSGGKAPILLSIVGPTPKKARRDQPRIPNRLRKLDLLGCQIAGGILGQLLAKNED